MDRESPECDLSMIASSNFTQSFGVPEQLPEIAELIRDGVEGDWPQGTTQVTETSVGHTVTDSNGSEVSGLALNILADDESNIPGGEPLTTGERVDIGEADDGTGSGSGSGSSSGGQEDAAVRVGGAQLTLLTMSALGLGMALL